MDGASDAQLGANAAEISDIGHGVRQGTIKPDDIGQRRDSKGIEDSDLNWRQDMGEVDLASRGRQRLLRHVSPLGDVGVTVGGVRYTSSGLSRPLRTYTSLIHRTPPRRIPEGLQFFYDAKSSNRQGSHSLPRNFSSRDRSLSPTDLHYLRKGPIPLYEPRQLHRTSSSEIHTHGDGGEFGGSAENVSESYGSLNRDGSFRGTSGSLHRSSSFRGSTRSLFERSFRGSTESLYEAESRSQHSVASPLYRTSSMTSLSQPLSISRPSSPSLSRYSYQDISASNPDISAAGFDHSFMRHDASLGGGTLKEGSLHYRQGLKTSGGGSNVQKYSEKKARGLGTRTSADDIRSSAMGHVDRSPTASDHNKSKSQPNLSNDLHSWNRESDHRKEIDKGNMGTNRDSGIFLDMSSEDIRRSVPRLDRTSEQDSFMSYRYDEVSSDELRHKNRTESTLKEGQNITGNEHQNIDRSFTGSLKHDFDHQKAKLDPSGQEKQHSMQWKVSSEDQSSSREDFSLPSSSLPQEQNLLKNSDEVRYPKMYAGATPLPASRDDFQNVGHKVMPRAEDAGIIPETVHRTDSAQVKGMKPLTSSDIDETKNEIVEDTICRTESAQSQAANNLFGLNYDNDMTHETRSFSPPHTADWIDKQIMDAHSDAVNMYDDNTLSAVTGTPESEDLNKRSPVIDFSSRLGAGSPPKTYDWIERLQRESDKQEILLPQLDRNTDELESVESDLISSPDSVLQIDVRKNNLSTFHDLYDGSNREPSSLKDDLMKKKSVTELQSSTASTIQNLEPSFTHENSDLKSESFTKPRYERFTVHSKDRYFDQTDDTGIISDGKFEKRSDSSTSDGQQYEMNNTKQLNQVTERIMQSDSRFSQRKGAIHSEEYGSHVDKGSDPQNKQSGASWDDQGGDDLGKTKQAVTEREHAEIISGKGSEHIQVFQRPQVHALQKANEISSKSAQDPAGSGRSLSKTNVADRISQFTLQDDAMMKQGSETVGSGSVTTWDSTHAGQSRSHWRNKTKHSPRASPLPEDTVMQNTEISRNAEQRSQQARKDSASKSDGSRRSISRKRSQSERLVSPPPSSVKLDEDFKESVLVSEEDIDIPPKSMKDKLAASVPAAKDFQESVGPRETSESKKEIEVSTTEGKIGTLATDSSSPPLSDSQNKLTPQLMQQSVEDDDSSHPPQKKSEAIQKLVSQFSQSEDLVDVSPSSASLVARGSISGRFPKLYQDINTSSRKPRKPSNNTTVEGDKLKPTNQRKVKETTDRLRDEADTLKNKAATAAKTKSSLNKNKASLSRGSQSQADGHKQDDYDDLLEQWKEKQQKKRSLHNRPDSISFDETSEGQGESAPDEKAENNVSKFGSRTYGEIYDSPDSPGWKPKSRWRNQSSTSDTADDTNMRYGLLAKQSNADQGPNAFEELADTSVRNPGVQESKISKSDHESLLMKAGESIIETSEYESSKEVKVKQRQSKLKDEDDIPVYPVRKQKENRSGHGNRAEEWRDNQQRKKSTLKFKNISLDIDTAKDRQRIEEERKAFWRKLERGSHASKASKYTEAESDSDEDGDTQSDAISLVSGIRDEWDSILQHTPKASKLREADSDISPNTSQYETKRDVLASESTGHEEDSTMLAVSSPKPRRRQRIQMTFDDDTDSQSDKFKEQKLRIAKYRSEKDDDLPPNRRKVRKPIPTLASTSTESSVSASNSFEAENATQSQAESQEDRFEPEEQRRQSKKKMLSSVAQHHSDVNSSSSIPVDAGRGSMRTAIGTFEEMDWQKGEPKRPVRESMLDDKVEPLEDSGRSMKSCQSITTKPLKQDANVPEKKYKEDSLRKGDLFLSKGLKNKPVDAGGGSMSTGIKSLEEMDWQKGELKSPVRESMLDDKVEPLEDGGMSMRSCQSHTTKPRKQDADVPEKKYKEDILRKGELVLGKGWKNEPADAGRGSMNTGIKSLEEMDWQKGKLKNPVRDSMLDDKVEPLEDSGTSMRSCQSHTTKPLKQDADVPEKKSKEILRKGELVPSKGLKNKPVDAGRGSMNTEIKSLEEMDWQKGEVKSPVGESMLDDKVEPLEGIGTSMRSRQSHATKSLKQDPHVPENKYKEDILKKGEFNLGKGLKNKPNDTGNESNGNLPAQNFNRSVFDEPTQPAHPRIKEVHHSDKKKKSSDQSVARQKHVFENWDNSTKVKVKKRTSVGRLTDTEIPEDYAWSSNQPEKQPEFIRRESDYDEVLQKWRERIGESETERPSRPNSVAGWYEDRSFSPTMSRLTASKRSMSMEMLDQPHYRRNRSPFRRQDSLRSAASSGSINMDGLESSEFDESFVEETGQGRHTNMSFTESRSRRHLEPGHALGAAYSMASINSSLTSLVEKNQIGDEEPELITPACSTPNLSFDFTDIPEPKISKLKERFEKTGDPSFHDERYKKDEWMSENQKSAGKSISVGSSDAEVLEQKSSKFERRAGVKSSSVENKGNLLYDETGKMGHSRLAESRSKFEHGGPSQQMPDGRNEEKNDFPSSVPSATKITNQNVNTKPSTDYQGNYLERTHEESSSVKPSKRNEEWDKTSASHGNDGDGPEMMRQKHDSKTIQPVSKGQAHSDSSSSNRAASATARHDPSFTSSGKKDRIAWEEAELASSTHLTPGHSEEMPKPNIAKLKERFENAVESPSGWDDKEREPPIQEYSKSTTSTSKSGRAEILKEKSSKLKDRFEDKLGSDNNEVVGTSRHAKLHKRSQNLPDDHSDEQDKSASRKSELEEKLGRQVGRPNPEDRSGWKREHTVPSSSTKSFPNQIADDAGIPKSNVIKRKKDLERKIEESSLMDETSQNRTLNTKPESHRIAQAGAPKSDKPEQLSKFDVETSKSIAKNKKGTLSRSDKKTASNSSSRMIVKGNVGEAELSTVEQTRPLERQEAPDGRSPPRKTNKKIDEKPVSPVRATNTANIQLDHEEISPMSSRNRSRKRCEVSNSTLSSDVVEDQELNSRKKDSEKHEKISVSVAGTTMQKRERSRSSKLASSEMSAIPDIVVSGETSAAELARLEGQIDPASSTRRVRDIQKSTEMGTDSDMEGELPKQRRYKQQDQSTSSDRRKKRFRDRSKLVGSGTSKTTSSDQLQASQQTKTDFEKGSHRDADQPVERRVRRRQEKPEPMQNEAGDHGRPFDHSELQELDDPEWGYAYQQPVNPPSYQSVMQMRNSDAADAAEAIEDSSNTSADHQNDAVKSGGEFPNFHDWEKTLQLKKVAVVTRKFDSEGKPYLTQYNVITKQSTTYEKHFESSGGVDHAGDQDTDEHFESLDDSFVSDGTSEISIGSQMSYWTAKSDFTLGMYNDGVCSVVRETVIAGEISDHSTVSERSGRRVQRECAPSFIIKPRRQFADEGTTAKFKASFDGEPPPEAVWEKDGKPLKNGDKYKLVEKNDFHFLEVMDVCDGDKGNYSCVLTNPLGKISASATLEVYATTRWKSTKNLPKLEKEMSDLTVTDGDKATLECIITGTTEPKIEWYKNGKLMRPSSDLKQMYNGRTAKLIFPEVFPEDAGKYDCVGKTPDGEVKTSAMLTVTAKPRKINKPREVAPTFTKHPLSQSVVDGDKVILECTVTGQPQPKVKWLKGQKEVKNSGDFKISFDGTTARLEIAEVYPEDSGEYTCLVENSAGEVKAKCRLTVKVPEESAKEKEPPPLPKTSAPPMPATKQPDVAKPKPETKAKSKPEVKLPPVEVESKVVVERSAPTKAEPKSSLEKVGHNESKVEKVGHNESKVEKVGHNESKVEKVVHNESKVESKVEKNANTEKSIHTEQTLTKASDANSKTVVQTQKTTMSFKTTSRTEKDPVAKPLAVEQKPTGRLASGPPTFTKKLVDLTVVDGDKVELVVEVQGAKPIDVVWLHNDKEIKKTSTVYKMAKEGTQYKLLIAEVFPEDGGLYVCEAYNTVGDEDCTCMLNVIDPPEQGAGKTGEASGKTGKDVADKYVDGALDEEDDDELFSPEFVKRPKGAHIDEGTSCKFVASVIGNPTPVVWWEKDGHQLANGGRFKVSGSDGDYTFEIPHTLATDAGRYVCVAKNSEGTEKCSVSLNVKELENSEVMDFRGLLKSRPGVHASKTRESKKQKDEQSNAPAFRSILKTRPQLKSITGGSGSDSDREAEQVDFRGVLAPAQTAIDVASPFPAVDPEKGGDQVDFRGVLHQSGTPHPDEVRPARLSREAEQIDFRDVISSSVIPEEESEDKRKSLAEPEQVDFREVIKRKTTTEKRVSNPEADQVDFRHVITKKSTVQIEEVVEKRTSVGPEQLDFRGSLNPTAESPVPAGESTEHDSDDDGSRTSRSSTGDSRSGDNEPEAEQQDFRNVLTRHVQTKQRPKVKKELHDITVREGDQVKLECHVFGIPPPRVRWYHKKKEIKESKYFQMTYENEAARLIIAEVYPEDEGEYMCIASNELGRTQSSCDIFVHELKSDLDESPRETKEQPSTMEPPCIEDLTPDNIHLLRGEKFQLRGKFVGAPRPNIFWHRDKTELKSGGRIKIEFVRDTTVLTISDTLPNDSGRYTLVVENEYGRDTCSSSVTVEDRPVPPGQPAASSITGTGLTLSWYGPSYDGGSIVTDYRVEMCVPGQDWKTLTSTCKYTSYQVKNLSPNTEYIFRISAANKHGFSEPSKASDMVVTIDRSLSSFKFDGEIPVELLMLSSPLSPDAFRAARDELPFEPRDVEITPDRKFADFYMLAEEIGKGRFGNVYKCIEKSSRREFAAKFIRVKPSERADMKQEMAVMNELHHPKLLMLYDAFESPRDMVLVMEHVAGGELFERIIDDDYILTERECVHFMRQICDSVKYMHESNILHLDMKPENILCITANSNEIKIIDFGLARKFNPKKSIRVLFGTPEFCAPEVVNYEQIGYPTDMWSVGVICYILISGLSPFLGDNEAETLSNVTGATWDFEDEAFDELTDDAKSFIEELLVKQPRKRLSAAQCLEHKWLSQDVKYMKAKRLSTDKHKRYMARRKWQKTGNAIRALGRMASLQRQLSGTSRQSSMDLPPSPQTTSPIHSRQSSTNSEESALTTNRQRVPPPVAPKRTSVVVDESPAEPTDSGIELEAKTNTKEVLSSSEDEKGSVKVNGEQNSRFTSKISMDTKSEESKSNGHVGRKSRSSTSSTEDEPNNNNTNAVAPSFVSAMRDFEVFEGDSARFDVKVAGDPEPDVTWLKEGTELKEGRKHVMDYFDDGACSLIIKNCGEDDDAVYECRAKNSAGEVSCSAELYVEDAC